MPFLFCLQVLGLEVCADTFVGDEMMRGISGGQRKRVTTGNGVPFLCLMFSWAPTATGVELVVWNNPDRGKAWFFGAFVA